MASWSRREQYQAYQFLYRRIVSAILAGEPETNELPMRRFGVAIAGGIGVAVLVFAGFIVWGLVSPGGARPAENTIIVERETGAKFIYLNGRLHPVLNLTSARLILAQEDPPTRTLSRASLRDVPRGRPVGIPGAPDALPDRASLVGLPWSVCSAPQSSTSVQLATHVLVGHVPAGGEPLGEDEGVLVTVESDDDRYLIWRDHRLRIPSSDTIAALGWAGVRPASVAARYLDALPAGADLAPLRIPGAGEPAARAGGLAPAAVGDLFRVADQHYVMLRDGLAPVSELSVLLMTAAGEDVEEASSQQVGPILLETAVEPPWMPAEPPTVYGADERFAMACAVYRGGNDVERPLTVESFAAIDGSLDSLNVNDSGVGVSDATLADRVAVPGGRGALAAVLTPPGSTAPGSVYVITDQGVRYPLPRAGAGDVQKSLGYGSVTPTAIPAAILELIPTGPALDPATAALFADPVPGSSTDDDADQ